MPFLGTYNTYGRGERWGNLRKKVHLQDPGIDGKIILRWVLKKWNEVVWTGLIWITIGRGGGHL
jgi:hypothetical protein